MRRREGQFPARYMVAATIAILTIGFCALSTIPEWAQDAYAAPPRDFTGTANRLSTASPTVTDAPFTVSFWARCDSTTAEGRIWELDDAASTAEDGWWIDIQSNNQLREVTVSNGTGSGNVEPVNTVTDGAWFHVFFVETTSADRTIVLNADLANAGTNTVARNPQNVIVTETFGCADNDGGGFSLPFDGQLQNVAIWDVALATSAATQLYAGVDPRAIGPGRGHLKGYWPLHETSGDANGWAGGALSLTGTLNAAGGVTIRGGTR